MAQGTIKVEYAWLHQLSDDLAQIATKFAQIDERSDFSVAVFGEDRVVHALGEFTSGWHDGRSRIREGVESLGETISATAQHYEDLDSNLADAARPSSAR